MYVSSNEYKDPNIGTSSYTWSITFVTPRGWIPLLRLYTDTVVGDNVTAQVTKIQNGSDTSLMFDPIPAWLTEIPLQSMESHQDMSNVEVYVRGDTGDVLKSVCDNSGNAVNNEMGMIKGTETSCAFRYEANITAIISNFTMQEIDGPNKIYLAVTVASQNCNVTTFKNEYISCIVGSVTWGYHAPSVLISGYGYAVLATPRRLFFAQSVYSIYPAIGSFAGGQIVTIEGRGLRSNASIQFVRISELCEIVHRDKVSYTGLCLILH